MIAEKGHFHFAEKYWGDPGPHGPPCFDGLEYTMDVVSRISFSWKSNIAEIKVRMVNFIKRIL